MSSRTQSLLYFELPLVESDRIYKPTSLARRIVNLEPTPEGTLRSVRGPCVYELSAKSALGRILGMCHLTSLGGANDLLVIRAGSRLLRHAGWEQDWLELETGLNNESRQKYPDVMVAINGRIIWSNGVDRPLVIDGARTYGHWTYPLGFERGPGAPAVLSPQTADVTGNLPLVNVPPNWHGYSHQGRIGTVGDTYQGQQGSLLSGSWNYAYCYEDFDGNLSPLSSIVSGSVKSQGCFYENQIDPSLTTENVVDDLTRSLYVQGLDRGPDHTAYLRLYRSPDTQHDTAELHLLARLPGNRGSPYPDNTPDGVLKAAPLAQNVIAIPHFRIACEYQGRLVVANTRANPGEIRISEPNFPGTFVSDMYIIPDGSGAEVTGLISLGGSLLAFTPRSTYQVILDAEGLRSIPLSKTIGCVAPKSIVGLEDGSVHWLGRDGFYRYDGGSITRTSDQITETVLALNPSRVGRADAMYDPDTSEYRCAVPYGTSSTNDRWLCFDLQRGGWRELRLGLHAGASCVTTDDRRLPLVGCYDPADDSWDVYVMGRESRTYTPPARTVLYASSEVRLGSDQTGLQRFNVSKLLIGFVECDSVVPLTVRVYKDGRNSSPVTTTCKLVENDFQSTWSYGTALLGTSAFRDPKICWARVDVDVTNCTSFRFELEISVAAGHLVLHGIAVVGEVVDTNGNRVTSSTWGTAP